MGKSEKLDASAPVLIDAQVHMESFRQVREARRAELVEDYVELISDLLVDGGEARQVDIAARLGVCLLYTSPSPRDATLSRMPSSA